MRGLFFGLVAKARLVTGYPRTGMETMKFGGYPMLQSVGRITVAGI